MRRNRCRLTVGAMPLPRLIRFAGVELALWASVYGAYLAVRGLTIGAPVAHAHDVVGLERALGVFRDASLQSFLAPAARFLSAYYMLGFGPVVRALLAVHPALMAVTVSATGNHFFFDAAGGPAVAWLTLVLLGLRNGDLADAIRGPSRADSAHGAFDQGDDHGTRNGQA